MFILGLRVNPNVNSPKPIRKRIWVTQLRQTWLHRRTNDESVPRQPQLPCRQTSGYRIQGHNSQSDSNNPWSEFTNRIAKLPKGHAVMTNLISHTKFAHRDSGIRD